MDPNNQHQQIEISSKLCKNCFTSEVQRKHVAYYFTDSETEMSKNATDYPNYNDAEDIFELLFLYLPAIKQSNGDKLGEELGTDNIIDVTHNLSNTEERQGNISEVREQNTIKGKNAKKINQELRKKSKKYVGYRPGSASFCK